MEFTSVQMLQRPKGLDELKKMFGDFKYVELSRGAVDVDDTWERDNIVTLRRLPGIRPPVQLHRLIAPHFEATLHAAQLALLKPYPIQLIGGYVPRHQRNDPKLPLSTHSWGIAVDFNWDKNPMKRPLTTNMPDAFVKAFTDRGWVWGGKFSTPDPMHFQFCEGF